MQQELEQEKQKQEALIRRLQTEETQHQQVVTSLQDTHKKEIEQKLQMWERQRESLQTEIKEREERLKREEASYPGPRQIPRPALGHTRSERMKKKRTKQPGLKSARLIQASSL